MAPETAQKRLQFVHLAWLGLGLTAAVSAAVGGAAPQNVFAAALMAIVPGIAGYAAARSGASELSGLPVIAWLVFALVAVVLTGGNASPLIILLIIAPLTGLLAGKPRLAAEAGTFAALALFCVFVATPSAAFRNRQSAPRRSPHRLPSRKASPPATCRWPPR